MGKGGAEGKVRGPRKIFGVEGGAPEKYLRLREGPPKKNPLFSLELTRHALKRTNIGAGPRKKFLHQRGAPEKMLAHREGPPKMFACEVCFLPPPLPHSKQVAMATGFHFEVYKRLCYRYSVIHKLWKLKKCLFPDFVFLNQTQPYNMFLETPPSKTSAGVSYNVVRRPVCECRPFA